MEVRTIILLRIKHSLAINLLRNKSFVGCNQCSGLLPVMYQLWPPTSGPQDPWGRGPLGPWGPDPQAPSLDPGDSGLTLTLSLNFAAMVTHVHARPHMCTCVKVVKDVSRCVGLWGLHPRPTRSRRLHLAITCKWTAEASVRAGALLSALLPSSEKLTRAERWPSAQTTHENVAAPLFLPFGLPAACSGAPHKLSGGRLQRLQAADP